jgi:hypothetical protein
MMKTATFAALALAGAANAATTRNLSNDQIAGYEPPSNVVDHNKLDKDQAAIEEQLKLGTEAAYAAAKKIYEMGAHSKVIAEINVPGGLTTSASKETVVSALSSDGRSVSGVLTQNYDPGATSIQVKLNPETKDCHGIGHPAPMTTGCFNTSGDLTIGGESLAYTHDYAQVSNGRTIAGFSTAADTKMSGWPTFQKFRRFYGSPDYAHQWVTAAFDGTSYGNFADFSQYGFDGRTQAIKKGTAYMNFWMYVIHEMEDAIQDCGSGCTAATCNDDAGVHAWDEAVAFYTGSLEGTDGSGSGVLLYALADKRSANFKTGGDLANSISGTSHVNLEIFREFGQGKDNIIAGNCAAATKNKENIEKMMAVPLVQGTLRYAWKAEYEDYSEKASAELATFGMAVLPVVNDCDSDAADTIFSEIKVGRRNVDHMAVKEAFESVYSCMGIRCEDVGGLWNDPAKEYYENAEPCGTGSADVKSDENAGFQATSAWSLAAAAAVYGLM